jgi:hypothetical protein
MTKSVEDYDYGPLTPLIGHWYGNQGKDVAPEPDGTEYNDYYESIIFEAAGDVENAEEQLLTILNYSQIVKRISNDKIFHRQTGFWMWDATNQEVIHSFVIPRGVSLVCGNHHDGKLLGPHKTCLSVSANAGDKEWCIVESPFMSKHASTKSFTLQLDVDGDTLSYKQNTVLDIYGRVFDHTDQNTLSKVKGA